MSKLNCKERKLLRSFLNLSIPQYIREYSDERFDLMDCYEVAFVFANDLLDNHRINPNFSPWGDGNSVIFDPAYSKLLEKIIGDCPDEGITCYCKIFLKTLDVFRLHFGW